MFPSSRKRRIHPSLGPLPMTRSPLLSSDPGSKTCDSHEHRQAVPAAASPPGTRQPMRPPSVPVPRRVVASKSTVCSSCSQAPASMTEEVEMDGRVVKHKGRMTAVTVEIRKKESGELVAIGRQWMTASRPRGSRSKI